MRLQLLRRIGLASVARWLNRASKRRYWEEAWGRDDYAPPWLGRGVAAEVVAAVRDGWFARGGAALDIGCGQGEIVAWLAEQGFDVVGVDISEAALARGRALVGASRAREASSANRASSARSTNGAARAEFRRVDICAPAPSSLEPNRFAILIDRGCFHQIADEDLPAFAANVVRVAAPDARFLLFVKAFRGAAAGDAGDAAAERARHIARVEGALGAAFAIERVTDTALDADEGRVAERRLPGLVFWMTRRPLREAHA
ncbi:MAG: class I SAM-dependent methyltransferase [bacterium]